VQLGHARLQITALAGVVLARGLLDQQPRGLQAGGHVGELQLDGLVLADGLAEGAALLAVAQCVLQRGTGQPHAARGHVDAPEFEAAYRMLEAATLLLADELVCRYPAVLEHELGAVDGAVAQLLQLLAHREALALLGQEQAHALVRGGGLRIGLGQDGEAGAMDAVGDPGLGAVEHIVVAIATRHGADALQVGAGIGLGQADAATDLAGGEARQPRPLLRLGTVALHGGGHDQVGVEDAGRRHPRLGNARDDAGIHGGRKSQTTVLGVDRRTEQAELLHLLDQVVGILVGVVELPRDGLDLALDPAVDAVEDLGFLVGKRRRLLTVRCHHPAPYRRFIRINAKVPSSDCQSSRGPMTGNASSDRAKREPGRPRRRGQRAATPRYRQIADELIGEIKAGRWKVGDTLPGDIELTHRFGVGRHTVRAALQQLERLGLISRRPRTGTVLQATEPTEAYTHSVQSTAGLLQYPANTPLRITESGPVQIKARLPGTLKLPRGSRWHHLGGLRASPDGGPPLCRVDVYLLPELAGIEQRIGRDARKIFEHIEEVAGQRVARVTIQLEAAAIAAEIADSLKVAPGSPALAITRRFYDDEGVLFEVSYSQHPAGRFSYELELARHWLANDPQRDEG
jgi:GntR family transcriptional regulator